MTARDWFDQAQKEGFAIGAFNVDNMDIFKAEIADFALGKLQHHRRFFVFASQTNSLENVHVIDIKSTDCEIFFLSSLEPLPSCHIKPQSLAVMSCKNTLLFFLLLTVFRVNL